MSGVIEASGLGKQYGRKWALRDCTLSIPAGRVVGAGDHEQNIFDVGEIVAGAANHFVGNVEADNAAIGNAFGKQAHEPAGAAADVEDIVLGADTHAVENRQGDGKMAFFHLLAAAGFGPAIEFFAE